MMSKNYFSHISKLLLVFSFSCSNESFRSDMQPFIDRNKTSPKKESIIRVRPRRKIFPTNNEEKDFYKMEESMVIKGYMPKRYYHDYNPPTSSSNFSKNGLLEGFMLGRKDGLTAVGAISNISSPVIPSDKTESKTIFDLSLSSIVGNNSNNKQICSVSSLLELFYSSLKEEIILTTIKNFQYSKLINLDRNIIEYIKISIENQIQCRNCVKPLVFDSYFYLTGEEYLCCNCYNKKTKMGIVYAKKFAISDFFNFEKLIDQVLNTPNKENNYLLAIRMYYLIQDYKEKEREKKTHTRSKSTGMSIMSRSSKELSKSRGLKLTIINEKPQKDSFRKKSSIKIEKPCLVFYDFSKLEELYKLALATCIILKSTSNDLYFSEERKENYFPSELLEKLMQSDFETLNLYLNIEYENTKIKILHHYFYSKLNFQKFNMCSNLFTINEILVLALALGDDEYVYGLEKLNIAAEKFSLGDFKKYVVSYFSCKDDAVKNISIEELKNGVLDERHEAILKCSSYSEALNLINSEEFKHNDLEIIYLKIKVGNYKTKICLDHCRPPSSVNNIGRIKSNNLDIFTPKKFLEEVNPSALQSALTVKIRGENSSTYPNL